MKTHLNTLEDICFNNLMPWLDDNSDMDLFEEILRAIDINMTKGHQSFFRHIIEMLHLTDTAITPSTLNEWKAFSCIKRNKKTEGLTKHIFTFPHTNSKVGFYTCLIAHSMNAIMSSLQGQMTILNSIPLKKQFINKYVIRLKRIIEADIPCDNHDEIDLLIIKLAKLGALAIYILLLLQYKKFIHPSNELTHSDIMAATAGISMTDKELEKKASALMQVYGDFVKSKRQPSPTNKLKELKQQAAGKTGEKERILSADHTIADHGRPEKQNSVNNETVGSREGEVERFIGSKEVMHILGIDKGTLHRLRNREDNKIPHSPSGKGGKIYYKVSDINNWLKRNQKTADEFEIRKHKQHITAIK